LRSEDLRLIRRLICPDRRNRHDRGAWCRIVVRGPGCRPTGVPWLFGETINLELGDAMVRLLGTEDRRPHLPASVLFARVRNDGRARGWHRKPHPGFALVRTGVST
jgi:hypothetical protein